MSHSAGTLTCAPADDGNAYSLSSLGPSVVFCRKALQLVWHCTSLISFGSNLEPQYQYCSMRSHVGPQSIACTLSILQQPSFLHALLGCMICCRCILCCVSHAGMYGKMSILFWLQAPLLTCTGRCLSCWCPSSCSWGALTCAQCK